MMEIKCTKCGREFTEEPNDYPGKVYVHHNEVICKDCLMDMGVLPDHAESSHTRLVTERALYLRIPY
jgi:DNA-directed RNA polymerase subunit RPC12/RpoP